MGFFDIFAAMLAANLMTVWAVWCFYQIFKHDRDAKLTAQIGLIFIALVTASGVYVATQ